VLRARALSTVLGVVRAICAPARLLGLHYVLKDIVAHYNTMPTGFGPPTPEHKRIRGQNRYSPDAKRKILKIYQRESVSCCPYTPHSEAPFSRCLLRQREIKYPAPVAKGRQWRLFTGEGSTCSHACRLPPISDGSSDCASVAVSDSGPNRSSAIENAGRLRCLSHPTP